MCACACVHVCMRAHACVRVGVCCTLDSIALQKHHVSKQSGDDNEASCWFCQSHSECGHSIRLFCAKAQCRKSQPNTSLKRCSNWPGAYQWRTNGRQTDAPTVPRSQKTIIASRASTSSFTLMLPSPLCATRIHQVRWPYPERLRALAVGHLYHPVAVAPVPRYDASSTSIELWVGTLALGCGHSHPAPPRPSAGA